MYEKATGSREQASKSTQHWPEINIKRYTAKKKTVYDQVKRKKPIKTTAEPKGRRRSKKKPTNETLQTDIML